MKIYLSVFLTCFTLWIAAPLMAQPRLALHYPLNGTGPDLLQEQVSGYNATSLTGVTATEGIHGQSNTAAAFNQANAKIIFRDLKSYLNPEGKGYSITCWVYTQPYTEGLHGRAPQPDDARDQIFFAADDQNTNLFGLKVIEDNLLADRYTDQVYPVKNWEFWLWRPGLFSKQGGWHMLLVSVHNSFMKYKVYPISSVGDSEACCNCELSYQSGQDLSIATNFGLGNNQTGSSAVQRIDEFKMYGDTLSFKQMDSLYTKEKQAAQSSFRQMAVEETAEDSTVLQMTVYPNPASDDLHVIFSSKQSGIGEVAFYNVSGRKVYQRPVDIRKEKQVITIRGLKGLGLKSGVYTFVLKTARHKQTSKIVIH